ncbi:MAG: hypothetical protein KKB81_07775 [Candidatus Margulisbacteria bacterium]|nr:hypothetical protein [Candidatus Margulisiibacteriota bacterium]MBU1021248.1 hypothetical protein [Candidatus Margulisiibacteriota bacterium]MBU1729853.1 hypothetical protein [Candidatus Margulisiibacteriota bacterium]MBU1955354.1 hypothetical protein [Candidatus Margulisiibacteriota bacterium]
MVANTNLVSRRCPFITKSAVQRPRFSIRTAVNRAGQALRVLPRTGRGYFLMENGTISRELTNLDARPYLSLRYPFELAERVRVWEDAFERSQDQEGCSSYLLPPLLPRNWIEKGLQMLVHGSLKTRELLSKHWKKDHPQTPGERLAYLIETVRRSSSQLRWAESNWDFDGAAEALRQKQDALLEIEQMHLPSTKK